MKLQDLQYNYPESLIALEPSNPTRVMLVNEDKQPVEMNIRSLLDLIPAGDVLVINETKVQKRRLFSGDTEILFLDFKSDPEGGHWTVMFPSKKFKVGEEIPLPNGSKMILLEKGLPQKVRVVPALTEKDFESFGEMPLPPYIQKARGERHNTGYDSKWYQTEWAKNLGSSAAPTASLHFSNEDMQYLKSKGVHVLQLTLHVGLGTFLPVKVVDLDQHVMHAEYYDMNPESWNQLLEIRKKGGKVWALGTTVTRTLETIARTNETSGFSKLLLQPGSEFLVVDRLMTNFHQPESTLLALVAAFVGLERVKSCYQWAIENKFKLFSYGDLSVWIK